MSPSISRPRGVYVCAAAQGAGKSLISLGLMDALHRHVDKVGFFRPIVTTSDPELDPMVLMLRDLCALNESE